MASFWSDVFNTDDNMSEAAREEAIATAVDDTFEKFDSNKDVLIDKTEFLTHLKGTSFPSFPTYPELTDPNLAEEEAPAPAEAEQ